MILKYNNKNYNLSYDFVLSFMNVKIFIDNLPITNKCPECEKLSIKDKKEEELDKIICSFLKYLEDLKYED